MGTLKGPSAMQNSLHQIDLVDKDGTHENVKLVSYPEYEDSWKSVACCAWLHIHNVLTKSVQH